MKSTINYENGKIYMITAKKTNKIYIGSTTYSIKHRLLGHKDDYNKWLNNYKHKKYVSSYKLLSPENGKIAIILLENYPCKTKYQLHKRETEWILKYRIICVNIQLPNKYIKKIRGKRPDIYRKISDINFVNTIDFID